MNVIIKHHERAGSSPVAVQALIHEGVNEQVQEMTNTCGQLAFPVGKEDRLVYAVDPKEGDVIGVLAYSQSQTDGVTRMTLSYVEPTSRRQGVFKQMWDAFIDQSREMGLKSVSFQVHTKNQPALAMAAALGANPATVTYRKAIL